MTLKTFTATAPSHWACYFLYGDVDDMDEDETEQADEFAAWLGGHIVDCEDAGFIAWHDARRFGALPADCRTYTALVETD